MGETAAATIPARAGTAKAKVIFVVSEDYYFLSHRLPMARAVRDLGCRVIVATHVNRDAEAIRAEGFEVAPIPMRRANANPLRELGTIMALARLFRRERPDVIHNVALKPIIDGSVAALLAPGSVVLNLFTGLGAVFTEAHGGGPLRRLVIAVLKSTLRGRRFHAVTQNPDDAGRLQALGIARPEAVTVIPGSGIDLAAFPATPEPEAAAGPPVALMVSRLLWDKGVGVLVEAARLLRARGVALRIQIAGAPDESNPRAVPQAYVDACNAEGAVEFLGRRDDVAALWRQAHIAVFPSHYPEGVPKCLLEAAACARPIVTTDTPGCRSLVPAGGPETETGLLVPPRDPAALAAALEALAGDPARRRRMGAAARRLVEREYADAAVAAALQELYARLLAEREEDRADPHSSGRA